MPPPPVAARRSLSVSSLTMKEKVSSTDDIITFNIGGQIYSTSRSNILANVDGQSFLALIINNQSTIPFDDQGRVFLDRDGTYFRYILNYFRDQQLILPENFTELKQLCLEAKFYQIDRLVNEIENRLNSRNELLKQSQTGINFTLISNLNQGGRLLTLIGPLKLIYVFPLESISRSFLTIIKNYTDLLNISCQYTFPIDDPLICCQAFDQLHRLVLAKQARKMGLAVSYSDDYIYLPIERSIMSHDDLSRLFQSEYQCQVSHTNVTYEKTNSNVNQDASYNLVENWSISHQALSRCEEMNGLTTPVPSIKAVL